MRNWYILSNYLYPWSIPPFCFYPLFSSPWLSSTNIFVLFWIKLLFYDSTDLKRFLISSIIESFLASRVDIFYISKAWVCSISSIRWAVTNFSSLILASTLLSSLLVNLSNCCLHFSIYLFICSFSAKDCCL